jgi:hypothetical protein
MGNSCPEIAGSDEIRSCTPVDFLTIWFQREHCESLLYVAIVGHVLKSEAENVIEAEM